MIIVQPKTSGPGYEVLGVGKVVTFQGSDCVLPDDVVPVFVAAVEKKPCVNILSVGQVVLWPKIHLAIPRSRPSEQSATQEHAGNITSPSSSTTSTEPSRAEDRLYNYASQCLQLGVLLMQLNDTEKEGDGERCIMNWKLLMLYFRSRSRGKKYAFEAMRLITYVKALYTEKMAFRITHGQFVNVRGGAGKNYANDLRMEMMVKDDKAILKGMCGNKTLKAVDRSTSSAYGLKKIVHVVDSESGVPPDSTQHTTTSTQETVAEMTEILHTKRPFRRTAGRTLKSFPNIPSSPLEQLDVATLYDWLTRNKRRLAVNAFERCDDDDYQECDEVQNEEEDSDTDVNEEEQLILE